ncbi:unnamed protein product [Chironomus riparius]|uniref:Meiosis-specific nuclear structural protein 1 n=1 Tax=Chironomus riparius TaxID=315576 RepID=A0A9N9S200_9DIPT|nr:unnamed protein product [Chironomus riparius]
MNSQHRIQFDAFSRKVCDNQKNQDYEYASQQIQRNSSSRHLQKLLIEEQKERELEEKLRKIELEKARHAEQLKIDQERSHEVMLQRRKEYHDKKMRQQVRENNQELRELESRLRSAYVSKALALQKKEQETLREVERLQEKQENEVLEQARLEHLRQLDIKRQKDKERKQQLRDDLRNQIISAHQQNQLLYEQFLKEKGYLDEIARRIQEELLVDAAKKKNAKERTLREMEAFKLAKKEMERIRQIEVDEENVRIKNYCEERDQKITEDERRCRELEQRRDCLNDKMVKELTELIERKHEREHLLQELWAFEENEKIEEQMRNKLEFQLRQRIEARLILEQQLMDQKQRKEREENDEKIFWEKQLQMLAERDKIEQLSNEKRRRKILEHRKAIQELLEQRKLQRVEALATEIRMREIEEQDEKRKQEIVEEERIKIIQEHAGALIGFIPKDILRETDKQNFSFAGIL